MSEFDRDILNAITGFSRESPQDLPVILAAVDARQRTILNHDELASGLAQLIEAGKVAEAGNYRLIRPVVAGFARPPGSCIVRQYEEPKREVTSDVVRDE